MEKINIADRYRERRKKLTEKIGNGVAMISQAACSPDIYLYDKNLEYLTGLTDAESILLIAPSGIIINQWESISTENVGRGELVYEALFVHETTDREKTITGERPGLAEISSQTGVDTVLSLSKFELALGSALMRTDTLWVNVPSAWRLSKPLSEDLVRLNRIRERYLWLNIRNIAPLIHEMRRVKDAYEIACLREAFRIHTEVYEKIMASLKPGDNEAKGKAIWDYETVLRGANVTGATMDRNGNTIIVGAGKNTAVAHYVDNNQEIKDGDLVLLDTGVAVNGYSSDITRTFPANGTFTPRQRELYAITLEAQKAAIATMRPGSTSRIAHKAVYDVFKKYGVEKWGYGFCGHPVGLNIHDANGRKADDDIPFEPGVVIVIEPFLFIPEEGIGIRIEDGVLITEDGCEVLTGPVKEIDDVEKLCQGK